MTPSRSQPDATVATAMVCAAAVTAQFVAGKAVRDTLFLQYLAVTSLPVMFIVTALVSIALVALSSRVLRVVPPHIFVPLSFVLSAALLLVEWGLAVAAPRVAAPIVYLHISGLGPMLGSGFWLIATEHFDPRTAKRKFGQIAGVGTLGGLAGGLLAERLATFADVTALLPVLAVLNLVCARAVRQLAAPLAERERERPMEIDPELGGAPARSGLHVLARAPYLQNLAALVLLGTMGAALAEYVFKAQAAATFASSEDLLRFFALFYAGVGVLTFIVQTAGSRIALERMGLAVTTGTPSIALLAGSVIAWAIPGLESIMGARGAESVLRSSLFRSGYELFYTPIPSEEKRAAKSVIDVGFDRAGEALGGGVIRTILFIAPLNPVPALLGVAIACSVVALAAASRLNRGYVQTLERSLMHRAVELDLSETEDRTTRTTMMRSLTALRKLRQTQVAPTGEQPPPRAEPDVSAARAGSQALLSNLDADMLQILALRSRDQERVRRALKSDQPLAAAMVPHAIPLLAWDPVANEAVQALRRVADRHVGELVDALVDPDQDFAIRRRLPRVLAQCASQRAADGLLLGLDDMRFEVRYQCARSLATIIERNPRIHVDRQLVFDVVQREAAVGRPVWESNRLLTRLDEAEENVFVDQFVKDRAGRSLAHVFTLLALVLPSGPLQIAYRGLHSDDSNLRGTALEYLESVLPPPIRERLWPYLEDSRPANRPARP
ncbi:MAG: Npt1/Npt2 family nucleotide transporter, partial [Vicinamibacterales bacterium]